MALKSTPGILGSHLQDIVDIGFGRWAKEEPLLARTACVALDGLSVEDKQKLRCGGIKFFLCRKAYKQVPGFQKTYVVLLQIKPLLLKW